MFVVVSLVFGFRETRTREEWAGRKWQADSPTARALIPHCFLDYEEVLSPSYLRSGANGSGVVKVF